MSFVLHGLGTAQPATQLDRDEALAIARSLCCETDEHATWLPGVYGQSGIDTRRLAFGRDLVDDILQGTRHSGSVFLPGTDGERGGPTTAQRMQYYAEHAPPLALAAARRALDEAGCPPGEISQLVTVSCTGFAAPGVDVQLIRGLGLPAVTPRTNVGFMGCHGALNGLRVARALAEADPGSKVLLCAVELCGLHYHYGWDPQKLVANALFADGAAALVGSVDGADDAWRLRDSGACLLPESETAMTWTVGDNGFEMTLSKQVPVLIARHLRGWLEEWLAGSGLSVDEIGTWAVHPGGPRILTAVEEALDLSPDATAVSREVLARCGNMSSPTLLFILDRLRRAAAPRPCVALGFGPGLNAESALFF